VNKYRIIYYQNYRIIILFSLLLSHLEGEEAPEAPFCAAVSDGEGSLIDAGERGYTLLGEIRFK
jgi:hypothetical protein